MCWRSWDFNERGKNVTKEQAGRLLTLAYYLKTRVPTEHFDMGVYVSDSGLWPADVEEGFATRLESHECGTSACAVGWGMVVFPNEWHTVGCEVRLRSRAGSTVTDCLQFYGIADYQEWYWLFSGAHRRTPKEEAKVLEDYARKKGWVYK